MAEKTIYRLGEFMTTRLSRILIVALAAVSLILMFWSSAIYVDCRREVERLERDNKLLQTQSVQLEDRVKTLEVENDLLRDANAMLSQQVRDSGEEPITDWGDVPAGRQ